jgi:Family of unknown function (DUF5681)
VGRFKRGRSGNPHGRPAGSRNRASVMLDAIAENQAADLLQTVLRRAHRGDLQAAALIFSRIWPIRKARVRFDLPSLDRAADLPRALAAVVAAVSNGLLSPDEAAAVATVLNAQRAAIELGEIEQRLRGLEQRTGNEIPRSPGQA